MNMFINQINGLRVLTPMSGYKIVNKEHTQVYDNVLYLGKYDSINNYDTMTIEEAETLIKKLEEENKQKYIIDKNI